MQRYVTRLCGVAVAAAWIAVACVQNNAAAAADSPSANNVPVGGAIPRSGEFGAAEGNLGTEQRGYAPLRQSNPAQWAKAEQHNLEEWEQLIGTYPDQADAALLQGNGPIARYEQLGVFQRFILRDFRGALASFNRAEALGLRVAGPKSGPPVLPVLWIADTLRFAGNDAKGALAAYQRALARVDAQPRPANPNETDIMLSGGMFARVWIGAEISYLQNQKRQVAPASGECDFLAVIKMYGSENALAGNDTLSALVHASMTDGGPSDPVRTATVLESLPPSQANLLGSISLWPVLGTPQRLLAFLHKHDPAGVLSGCALQVLRVGTYTLSKGADVTHLEVQAMGWPASSSEMMTEVALDLLGAPDPSAYASDGYPDYVAALINLRAALYKNDRGTIEKIMAPELRAKLADRLSDPARTRELANLFVGPPKEKARQGTHLIVAIAGSDGQQRDFDINYGERRFRLVSIGDPYVP